MKPFPKKVRPEDVVYNLEVKTREEALTYLKSRLNEEVEAGRMTQEQADRNFEINSRWINNRNQGSMTVQVNGNTAIINNNSTGGRTFAEMFAGVEDFGVTFSGDIFNSGLGNIYYQGQLVRQLIDDTAGYSTWISSSSDRGGNMDIRIIRGVNGNITGVEVV